MPPLLYIGPARSGKSAGLLRDYARTIAESPPGAGLWIAPNQNAVAEVRARLAAALGRGALLPGCYTFAQFADTLLAHTDLPLRPVDKLLKRRFLLDAVRGLTAAGKLSYFAPIVEQEGFLAWLDHLTADLKRQEVWPEEFEKATKHLGKRKKDRELAIIYAEYQKLLAEAGAYDVEGRFWIAHELLTKGEWGPFAEVRHVVVDGFTDFTRTQLEILKLLAARSARFEATLPDEAPCDETAYAERADLFLRPRATLEELKKTLPELRLERVTRTTISDWPAMTHIERRVFGNPRRTVDAPSTDGIELWLCEHQLGELRRIAHEIKRLLLDGEQVAGKTVPIAAEEIAVVYRSLAPVAPLVREVFTEFGLPFVLGEGTPLAESPLVVALVNAVQMIAEDWPYRRVLQTLANGYFEIPLKPGDDPWEARAAADSAVREVQIDGGRTVLLEAVRKRLEIARAHLARAEAEGSEDLADIRAAIKRRALGVRTLEALARVCDMLPTRASWAEWRGALQRFVKALGTLRIAQRPIDSVGAQGDGPAADMIAWRQLLSGLHAAARRERWSGELPRNVPRDEFLAEMILVGQSRTLAPENDGVGRVRVLSASMARTGEFKQLFLAGLTEKAFPQSGGDERFYDAAEMNRLNGAGLRFIERRARAAGEMLLFYEVLTRATRRLVLSYAALDDSAEALAPSPFVGEVERACGRTLIARRDEIHLSPIPPDERPVRSAREERLRATANLIRGDAGSLDRLVASRGSDAASLIDGLSAIDGRATRGEFGRFDGMFQASSARNTVHKMFGPEHLWSTSQLETYAVCPFRFFASRVLKLSPLPELAFATDHMGRGIWFHAAMTGLHRTHGMDAAVLKTLREDPAEFMRLVAEALDVGDPTPNEREPLAAALRTIDRRFLERWFGEFLKQTEGYSTASPQDFRPAHFEVAFGPARMQDRTDPLNTNEPWEEYIDGERLRVTGQVDRIDLGRVGDQTIFGIVDYKTGRAKPFKPDDFPEGVRLQLPLYALVVERLLLKRHGAIAWQMGYWSVKENKVVPFRLGELRDGEVVPTDAWIEQREALLKRLAELARGIRRGEFPPANPDENCGAMCDFKTICRVGQARALEKQWIPPNALALVEEIGDAEEDE